MQQVGRPVCQQAVSLHLPKSDATTQLAALDGLVCQLIDWSQGAHLYTRATGVGKEER